jgi:hypothetical protein
MATENIKLIKSQQDNFTVDQGYFYTFDHDQDSLLQKTDDGNTAFSYPFDTLMANTAADVVKSAEFDGVYFWSLQNKSDRVSIKRWKIDNYVCKLQQTFDYLDSDPNNTYDSQAFSVAHYHTQLSTAVASGVGTIYFDDYWDDTTLMNFTTTSGDGLTLHLGPNSNGEEEDVEVTGTVASGVTISGTTQYAYAENDSVNFYTYLWVFNNYNGNSSATGALYKFDAYTGDYITKYAGGAYKDITAATFYNVDSFASYGSVDTLAYVKGTNTLFINVGAAGVSLPYYGSMVMENIKLDEATVIPIYDICMDDQNVYRLQDIPDGTNTTWSTYSYLLSSLDAFVTSISLAAYPAIIAANTVATTDIIAIVKDQFLQPIVGRAVNFTEDDPVGSISGGTPKNTDGDGRAATIYTSGNTAREVKITAVVEQT